MNARSATWAEHHLPSAHLCPSRRALIRSAAIIGAYVALATVLCLTREPLALVLIPLGLPVALDAVPELLARTQRRSELVAVPGALEFRIWPVVHRIAYDDLLAVTVRQSPWSRHPRIVTHLVGGAVAELEVTRGADKAAPWPDFLAAVLAAHGHRMRVEDLVRLRALVPGAAPCQERHDLPAGALGGALGRISGPFRTRAPLADAVAVHPETRHGETVLRVIYADGATRAIALDGMDDAIHPWGPAVLLACHDNGINVAPEARLWLAGHPSS